MYLPIGVLEAAGRNTVSKGMPLKVIVGDNLRGRQVTQVLGKDEGSPTTPAHTQHTTIASRDEDVFVHATALSRSGITALTEGQEILMECGQGRKGLEVRKLRLS